MYQVWGNSLWLISHNKIEVPILKNICVSRDMTKPTKWVCAQRRLRSAWASAQSDQSLLSIWRKLGPLATHWAHSRDSDQTGRMPRLIWVFAGRTVISLVLSCHGSHVCILSRIYLWKFELRHDKTNKITMRPAETLHLPSLISLHCPHEEIMGP